MSTMWSWFLLVVVAVTISHVQGQKRARPAMAELEMLVGSDPSSLNTESENNNYGQLKSLSDTLRRLQVLDKYYAHQARPRYGRSADPAF
ncbi:hypothetical protein RvY_02250 [Ramazzottius varieornatus]|uniref:Uncharacterized protein n=1 Tax=Ramazzottius varieornatus TaxID=947166 RepID=A0A1D1UU83_RAMVA|nr:hypothetical protein RvY_02250 [Ramazzottius varieornatus]